MNRYHALTRRTPRRLRSATLREGAVTRTDLRRIIRRTVDPQISDRWEQADRADTVIMQRFDNYKLETQQAITEIREINTTHTEQLKILEKRPIDGTTAACLTPEEVTALCNAIFGTPT